MNSTALDMRIKMLEDGLERLKKSYEQFFAGVSKIPPLSQHEDWKKELRTINPADLSSSSLKFRFVNLKQRVQQLESHWQRVCKQIEEGTYVRDRFKAKISSETKETQRPQFVNHKELQALETLYAKVSKASLKVPNKDRFIEQMSLQVQSFKEKNPGQKMQFRVAKDAKGQLQVKISKKA